MVRETPAEHPKDNNGQTCDVMRGKCGFTKVPGYTDVICVTEGTSSTLGQNIWWLSTAFARFWKTSDPPPPLGLEAVGP